MVTRTEGPTRTHGPAGSVAKLTKAMRTREREKGKGKRRRTATDRQNLDTHSDRERETGKESESARASEGGGVAGTYDPVDELPVPFQPADLRAVFRVPDNDEVVAPARGEGGAVGRPRDALHPVCVAWCTRAKGATRGADHVGAARNGGRCQATRANGVRVPAGQRANTGIPGVSAPAVGVCCRASYAPSVRSEI